MKIENLNTSFRNGRQRISSKIIWEDSDLKSQEVYFETDEQFSEDLTCSPHPFLISSLVPAFHAGEKRIAIKEAVCPELKVGLETAIKLIHQWYYTAKRSDFKVEAKIEKFPACTQRRDRAGFFFSGGVDSLATLRANRLNIPLGHPGSIKDGILVYGLEVTSPDSFSYVRTAMQEIAANAGITLVPIYTNVRELNEDWDFWQYQWEGSVFSAIAHSLTKRLGAVYIASTHDIPSLVPYGTHPLLDPLFSSCALKILHDGIGLSRLERTYLIADWEIVLNNLRVCNRSELYESNKLNCGRCEKCIRTMLELIAVGGLDKTKVFPVKDLSSEDVLSIKWIRPASRPYYQEMIKPLREGGRSDLADAIERKLSSIISNKPAQKGPRVVEMIRRADYKYLGGNLRRLKNRLLI